MRLVSVAALAAARNAAAHGEPLYVAFNRGTLAGLTAALDDTDAEYLTESEALAERRADRHARRAERGQCPCPGCGANLNRGQRHDDDCPLV